MFQLLCFSLLLLLLSIQTSAREVDLSWQAFPDARAYQIYISKSPNFKPLVLKKLTRKPRVKVNLKMGDFYWKVRAIDKSKKPGFWSEPGRVAVKPYPPELQLPKNQTEYDFFEVGPDIEFTWKPVEGKPTYEIFIYKTTGRKVLEDTTTENIYKTNKLKEGEYMWKMRTIYDGVYISDYCEPRRFLIEKKDLEAPKLISPIENKVIPSYRKVRFEWQRGKNSNFSDIEIKPIEVSEKGFQSIKIENLEDLNYENDGLPPGKYAWNIKGKEAKNTVGKRTADATFSADSSIIDSNNHAIRFGYGYGFFSQTFRGESGGTSLKTDETANALVYYWEGRWQIGPSHSLSFDLMDADFSDTQNYPYYKSNIYNRFRFGIPGFQQSFVLGYRNTAFNGLVGTTPTYLQTSGIVIGIEMTGTVNAKFKTNFGFLYHKPTRLIKEVATFKGDNYETFVDIRYNFYRKIWLNYSMRYEFGINKIKVKDSDDYVKFQPVLLIPVQLGFNFEY